MNHLHPAEITKIVLNTIALALSIGAFVFVLLHIENVYVIIGFISFAGIFFGIGSLIKWR